MPREKVKIAIITWVDACYQSKEAFMNELAEEMKVISAGVFIRETDKSIAIGQDFYYDEQEKSWRYIKHIPKVCITKKKIIEV